MNRKTEGVGFIRSGKYEMLATEGVGIARDNIVTRRLSTEGVFLGKKVRCTEGIKVEGVAKGRIDACGCVDISLIAGETKIQRTDDNKVVFKGEGVITVSAVEVDDFHFQGKCKIGTLKAKEVFILKANNNQVNQPQSIVDEIVCKKLIAYNLKARKVTAQEVELYGDSVIDTLVYEAMSHCSSECVIKKPVMMQEGASDKFV